MANTETLPISVSLSNTVVTATMQNNKSFLKHHLLMMYTD